MEERNISTEVNADNKKLVIINDIRFKGKRKIHWEEVKEYLKGYVGDYYEIEETGERGYCHSAVNSKCDKSFF